MQLAANYFNRIHRQFHVNKMPFFHLFPSHSLCLSLYYSVCDFVWSSQALKLFSFILKRKWYLHTACGIFISIVRSQAHTYPVTCQEEGSDVYYVLWGTSTIPQNWMTINYIYSIYSWYNINFVDESNYVCLSIRLFFTM